MNPPELLVLEERIRAVAPGLADEVHSAIVDLQSSTGMLRQMNDRQKLALEEARAEIKRKMELLASTEAQVAGLIQRVIRAESAVVRLAMANEHRRQANQTPAEGEWRLASRVAELETQNARLAAELIKADSK